MDFGHPCNRLLDTVFRILGPCNRNKNTVAPSHYKMSSIIARKQEQSTTRCVSPHAKEYTTDMILDSLDSLFQRMIAQPALNGAGSLAELLLKIHGDGGGWGG